MTLLHRETATRRRNKTIWHSKQWPQVIRHWDEDEDGIEKLKKTTCLPCRPWHTCSPSVSLAGALMASLVIISIKMILSLILLLYYYYLFLQGVLWWLARSSRLWLIMKFMTMIMLMKTRINRVSLGSLQLWLRALDKGNKKLKLYFV